MSISGTGNSATRINEITADDIATLRRYIIGWDSGVVKGFEETHTETSLTLSSGLMFAYEYFGYEDTKTLYFNPTAVAQYHFIYGELDRSVVPNTFEIKVKNNQAGKDVKPTTFRQDILSQIKTGIFQLPLYRVTLDSHGITEVKDLRSEKGYIQKVNCANITTKKVVREISKGATVPTLDERLNTKQIANTLFVHNACIRYIANNGNLYKNVNITIVAKENGNATDKILFSANNIVLNEIDNSATITYTLEPNYTASIPTTSQYFSTRISNNSLIVTLLESPLENIDCTITVNIFSLSLFRIDNISYAGTGMTWYDWCNSPNNTGNWQCTSSNGFVYSGREQVSTLGTRDSRVNGQDIIESRDYYSWLAPLPPEPN